MIRAVIFDKDGVLVDTESGKAESWKSALAKYGREVGPGWYFERMGPSGLAIAEMAVEEFDLEVQPGKLSREREMLYRGNCTAPPLEANVAFARYAASQPVLTALATSSTRPTTESHLFDLGIPYLFDVRATVEDVENPKPHPEIYLRIASALRVAPENCAVIEDLTTGVVGAREAGTKVVGVQSKLYDANLSDAHLVVPNLAGLTIAELNRQLYKEE